MPRMTWMHATGAESSSVVAPSVERLWTARVVHTALEEGLAKMDMAIATYGRREPLSLFCYGEPGTGKTTLAELFMDRHRRAGRPWRILYILLPWPASPSTILEELLDTLGDPFPARGTVANRMRRCRALFVRERVRLLILDELGNFIDSESGRILLAAGVLAEDVHDAARPPDRGARRWRDRVPGA